MLDHLFQRELKQDLTLLFPQFILTSGIQVTSLILGLDIFL